jgi:hypothetical protein
MKNRYFLALALAGVVSFAACSKSDNAAPADEPVVTDTTAAPATTAPAMSDTAMAPMDTGAAAAGTASAPGADTTM